MIETLQAQIFWNNTAWDYLVAFGVFVLLLLMLKIFQVIILKKLRTLAKKTRTNLDDAFIDYISSIKPPVYLLVSLWVGAQLIILPDYIQKAIMFFFVIVLVYEVVRAMEKVVVYGIESYGRKKSAEYDPRQNASMVHLSKLIVRITLWSIGLLMILSNLGVNISSLVASLGIGGIAIALAVQNVLGDVFSSFSIYLDKPFEVGDFITIGTDSGTVEKIGLKTTRIKTMRGEELVVPNKELTSTRVQNFKKLDKRRDVIEIGVTYDTSYDKLEKIPTMVEEVISSVAGVDFDRCHFSKYADSSLNFEIVYFVGTSAYAEFMDAKQQINLNLFKRFAEEKIEFAYPTQTLFVNKA
ncbi:mechanosensitive ion channel protein MscS [Candidatus Parcubacteria bacterium]|nr:MAG: mechanosensitive ion channel protein MscS [Candidatus Parcubacteria bacterium]